MSPDLIRIVHSANEELSQALSRLSAPGEDGASIPLKPGEVRYLGEVVERVGKALPLLGELAPAVGGMDARLGSEIGEYTRQLERLKTVLENIQPDLAKLRDQLQAERLRLCSTRKWTGSLKLTR